MHPFEVGETARLLVDIDHSFFFDAGDRLVAGSA
jgi:hypothetical protein